MQPLLSSQRHPKPGINCSESVVRCISCMQFSAVCACSLVHVVTPWMLGAVEVALMLVLYLVVVPNSFDYLQKAAGAGHSGHSKYHFVFQSSMEDVLILSVIRVVLLSVSYGFGSGKYCHRPYYIVAVFTSMFMIPYVIVKGTITNLRPIETIVALLITSAVFSVVHVVVARLTVKRTQRRLNMGLIGFGYPWEEGEEAWVMAGRQQSIMESALNEDLMTSDLDVPREVLADHDSKFVDCGGVSVHYKEEYPIGHPDAIDPSFAVVLIHGFGGGVFAWRNLMRAIAEFCGCRVVAFDRPAFGFTSRPNIKEGRANYYTMDSQRKLTVKLCQALGIRRTVLVAHADGCTLALMIAASMRSWTSAELRQMGAYPVQGWDMPPIDKRGPVELSGRRSRNDSRAPVSGLSFDNYDKGGANMSQQFVHGVPSSCETPAPQAMVNSALNSSCHSLEVEAIAFLHPDFSCEYGMGFTNLLLQSKLGRKFLRPLLRSEIGEVANRRAWYDTSKLTHDILDLYKTPLRIQGWDSALVEFTRVKNQVSSQNIAECKRRAAGLPMIVVTGEQDRLVPPEKAVGIAYDLGSANVSVLPSCGHLSHEECPEMLLELLTGFVERIYGSIPVDNLG